MFNSVSALNTRIEELESHKLQLLAKLKSLGDKGGLEYIIKTQKLENLQAKEFENRVQVENYDPQARRDEHENILQDEYRETRKKSQK